MTFVVVLLFVLLFGIITYGYMMSFKQSMTQAAAEGARAGAIAPSGEAVDRANAAVADAVNAFGQSCGVEGLSCDIIEDACPNQPSKQCITVRLSYDYQNYPLLPVVPLIGSALPDTLVSQSTAQVG
jgi:Flp pilus assembly protein TadG